MARVDLQRQAEAEIALEFGSDPGVACDGAPVFRDAYGLGSYRASIALTSPELNRSSSAAAMPSASVGSKWESDIRVSCSCWLNCDAVRLGQP